MSTPSKPVPEHAALPAPESTGADSAGQPSHTAYLLDILSGKYRVQAVSTLAALGIPDLLFERPRSAAELAAELHTDVDALDRLLRFTVGLGFIEASNADVYSLTSRGEILRAAALGPLATFVGAPEQWDPWARLRDTLQHAQASSPDGSLPLPSQPAFQATFGVDLYEYLAAHPDAAKRYDMAIDAFTQQEASALSASFDFGSTRSIVDVGGGRGTLLHEVLSRWPKLSGVLFDRPDVVERARAESPSELADRMTFEGGDFFDSLPRGHDCYCLKHVLHNWDDERATALLAACAAAIGPDGHVLVIEAILTPDNRPDLARVLDLEMSVLTSGRARRKPELRRLFRAAGLTLGEVLPVGSSWLLVGRRGG